MRTQPIAVVVDDSRQFLMYLEILLRRMNFEVLAVDSADVALEVLQVTRPNLMTMDTDMTGADGLGILRALRADEQLADLPVIVISNGVGKGRQWEALSLGCIDVLEKPVDLRQLHKAVQRCDLYPGGRRRYMRAPFAVPVGVHFGSEFLLAESLTLSERGISMRCEALLEQDSHIDVDLPLGDDKTVRVGGAVVYGTGKVDDPSEKNHIYAIKFERLTQQNLADISALVEKLLIGDLVEEQPELFVKPKR